MSDHNENNLGEAKRTMSSYGHPRASERQTKDKQGPQAPRMGAGEKPHPGRHSSGGDLRGVKPRAGAKPPTSISGRRVRTAKRRRASGLPLEKQTMAGPKGKLPDHAIYTRIGQALAEAIKLSPEQLKARHAKAKAGGDEASAAWDKAIEKKDDAAIQRARTRTLRKRTVQGGREGEAKVRGIDLGHSVYHKVGQTLSERNAANKDLKNKAIPRREQDYEPGDHSSGGWSRGKRKIRGQRPPREGEPPNERGHEGRAPMRNIPKKAAMKRRGMSGPKGPLPGKRESASYRQLGYTIAEALGLVSESDKSPEAVIAAQKERDRARVAANRRAIAKAATGKGAATKGQHPSKADPNKGLSAEVARRKGRSPSA